MWLSGLNVHVLHAGIHVTLWKKPQAKGADADADADAVKLQGIS